MSTYSTRFIGHTVTVTVDRPIGSRHPDHGFINPVNYGYIRGVIAPDGEDLDAYILGVFEMWRFWVGSRRIPLTCGLSCTIVGARSHIS